MDTLPRWASAALAANCAEMIAPGLETFWPSVPDSDRRLLTTAIQATKRSANTGVPTAELGEIADRITELVGRFELFLHARENNDPEIEDDSQLSFPNSDLRKVRITRTILDVAARAARLAEIDDRELAFSECGDALEWARAVMDHLADGTEIERTLDETIDSLWAFCEESEVSDVDGVAWTDDGWQVVTPERRT